MEVRISYWTLSRSPYYSFIFVLPFLAMYEVMVLFLNRDQLISLRNGADVLMRQLRFECVLHFNFFVCIPNSKERLEYYSNQK